MKIVKNSGAERVLDLIEPHVGPGRSLDVATPGLSLFAFDALQAKLEALAKGRLVLPAEGDGTTLLGGEGDRSSRNALRGRWLAARFA